MQITITSRGSWTSALAPMPFPVHYYTATRLTNGLVLVAGGFNQLAPSRAWPAWTSTTW